MPIRNRLTKLLDIEHPVLLAPMDLVSGGRLAAAVSQAGGLGLLGGGYGNAEWIEREWGRAGNGRIGCGFITWSIAKNPDVLHRALVHRPAAVMLSFGDPRPFGEIIKAAGSKLICQVQTLAHARQAIEARADVIVAQGTEAGGHGMSSPLMTFLPQVVDLVVDACPDTPVVAAGGIADGRGFAAAFALGAEGVMMGTRFMSSAESPVHPNWKQAITDSAVTLNIAPGMPGITMRVADTELAQAVFRGDVDPAGNPYAGPFLEAFEHGRLDKAMVGCGESATLIGAVKSVAEIVAETVDGFWAEVERLAAMLPRR